MLFATDNGKYEKGRNFPDSWKLKGIDADAAPNLGSYPPNPAGLYGMLDYLSMEWVQDWYDPDYYKHSPVLNPQGGTEADSIDPKHPQFGPRKVLRGLQGSSPEMGGYVFSRGYGLPQTMYPTQYNELTKKQKWERAPGYSSIPSTQFRCVINPAPAKPSSSKSDAATGTAPR